MADLSGVEKHAIEIAFRMDSGYVLTFSDRTFRGAILDAAHVDIDEERFFAGGGSKAKRLRTFMAVEPAHTVAAALAAFIEIALNQPPNLHPPDQFAAVRRIVDRLRSQGVPDLAAFAPRDASAEFDALARSIREAVARGAPEAGLDRAHTFMTSFLRKVCAERGLTLERETPLHNLMGLYAKSIRESGQADSRMTGEILRAIGRVFDAFNDVRNNRSLAHDNPMLRRPEATFILNNVASAIRFIEALEADRDAPPF